MSPTQIDVWVLAPGRVTPDTWEELELDWGTISLLEDGSSDYDEQLGRALDEAGGRGFVVESAGPVKAFLGDTNEEVAAVLDDGSYLTRFRSIASSEEMLVDPGWVPAPDLTDVPRDHVVGVVSEGPVAQRTAPRVAPFASLLLAPWWIRRRRVGRALPTLVVLGLGGCVAPGPISVEAGRGEAEFEPLADGPVPLERGSQGGVHLWGAVRVWGSESARPLAVSFTLSGEDGVHSLPGTVHRTPRSAGDGAEEAAGFRVVIRYFAELPDDWATRTRTQIEADLAAATFDLEVTVEDEAGEQASDTRRVTLEFPPVPTG